MRRTLKNYALGMCLFVFLFVIIGGEFHLGPGGALVGAISGTPLVIFAYNRWYSAQIQAKAHGRGIRHASSPIARPTMKRL